MPVSNLAALWGPTLATVDAMNTLNFDENWAEIGITIDLIEHFLTLFDINEEELEQEKVGLELLRQELEGLSRKFGGSADIKVKIYEFFITF